MPFSPFFLIFFPLSLSIIIAGVQLAIAMGAERVVTISSAKNVQFVQSLGPKGKIHALAYDLPNFAENLKAAARDGFDLIYDTVTSFEVSNTRLCLIGSLHL
jgi:NADPH:quinone reductase-like Zn-dependent oxidoreductase